jgi:4-aminobutyrate--pyruvate transaminase
MTGRGAQAHEYGTFGHGVTYGGHPVGAAVALECLDIYEEMDLPPMCRRLGRRIAQRLGDRGAARRDRHALPGDAGGGGASPRRAGRKPGRAVGAEAEARGVFFRVIGDVLAIAPPYIITPEEIDIIMDVMRDAILAIAAADRGANANVAV